VFVLDVTDDRLDGGTPLASEVGAMRQSVDNGRSRMQMAPAGWTLMCGEAEAGSPFNFGPSSWISFAEIAAT